MNVVNPTRHASTWMILACGVWLVALGLYFILLRPPLLPEDPRFMGTTVEQLRLAAPGMEGWLQKVFTVLGGFMAGAGVLTVWVAHRGHAGAIEGYVLGSCPFGRAHCGVDERHQLCASV